LEQGGASGDHRSKINLMSLQRGAPDHHQQHPGLGAESSLSNRALITSQMVANINKGRKKGNDGIIAGNPGRRFEKDAHYNAGK